MAFLRAVLSACLACDYPLSRVLMIRGNSSFP